MKVVVFDVTGEFECHKADCNDVNKKFAKVRGVPHHWFEDSVEQAENNFNINFGVDGGYEPPWVWVEHVKVYPCAKKG